MFEVCMFIYIVTVLVLDVAIETYVRICIL